MKRKANALLGMLLLLLAGGCLQACSEDDFGGRLPDRETLIAKGRYLAATNEEAIALQVDEDKTKWFPVGTPYRLLAFTKAYDKNAPLDARTATCPRFNKVAWESESGGLRFINIDMSPDKWFGFVKIGAEEGDPDDGLVSLDFYGFTYGKEEHRTTSYIEIDGLSGETLPPAGNLSDLKRTERVTDGVLNDLLWGRISNQNITTAGQGVTPPSVQSILPFRHCFSRLNFFVVQQAEAGTEESEAPVPCFSNIIVDAINVTNTYSEGSVYLRDGRVELAEASNGSRPLKLTYDGEVPTTQTEVGEMMVFPSAGESLKNKALADGYKLGLEITVKSTDEATITRFKEKMPAEQVETWTKDGYHYLKVTKEQITNSYTNTPLYLKQNTYYTLVISFQEDIVRIITVIPQVEEWVPGEGDEEDPWQNQAIGQPQMFDNILWSDRNLGADHFDPETDFEQTIGYFYQAGRNIPYYPFDTELYANDDRTGAPDSLPNPYHRKYSILANAGGWDDSRYKLYPMVDKRILRMKRQRSGWGTDAGSNGNDYTWIIWGNDSEKPQLYIKEAPPEGGTYFDFMRGQNTDSYKLPWDQGQDYQPLAGLWHVPSSDQFLSIFPSTPHAGNITFRAGGNNSVPMDWGGTPNEMGASWKTLRVTVPFYSKDPQYPNKQIENIDNNNWGGNPQYAAYKKAYQTLVDNNDAGSTHMEAYTCNYHNHNSHQTASPYHNAIWEPYGDPENGFASVYVISREEGSAGSLPDELKNKGFTIESWGTIYAIKRVYTSEAYRMRWRVVCRAYGTKKRNPGMYLEICRYRCEINDSLTEENYKTYDWNHPAAKIYFPVCGLGDYTGNYINFGTECQYATCDKITGGKTGAVQIKITGDNATNSYISVVKGVINRNFGMQIRPVGGGK